MHSVRYLSNVWVLLHWKCGMSKKKWQPGCQTNQLAPGPGFKSRYPLEQHDMQQAKACSLSCHCLFNPHYKKNPQWIEGGLHSYVLATTSTISAALMVVWGGEACGHSSGLVSGCHIEWRGMQKMVEGCDGVESLQAEVRVWNVERRKCKGLRFWEDSTAVGRVDPYANWGGHTHCYLNAVVVVWETCKFSTNLQDNWTFITLPPKWRDKVQNSQV